MAASYKMFFSDQCNRAEATPCIVLLCESVIRVRHNGMTCDYARKLPVLAFVPCQKSNRECAKISPCRWKRNSPSSINSSISASYRALLPVFWFISHMITPHWSWLPYPDYLLLLKIDFKILLITYQALRGQASKVLLKFLKTPEFELLTVICWSFLMCALSWNGDWEDRQ